MMKNITTWPFIFPIIAVLMRVVMEKMIKVSDARKQFIWVGILFGLYTVLLLGLVCLTYWEMLSKSGSGIEAYHEQVVLLIIVMAAVMLFAGVLCYVRMGKRRLSDADKMKLRDM